NGQAGPQRRNAVKVYYCPSRRFAAPLNNGRGLNDYASVAPGQVPLHRNSAGLLEDDPIGLVYGWASGTCGYSDGDFGLHHGVIPIGNRWAGELTRHTFASVKDGTSNTMMVGEKFVPINDYGGGNGADDTGPMEGVDPDVIRSTATCQDFSFDTG